MRVMYIEKLDEMPLVGIGTLPPMQIGDIFEVTGEFHYNGGVYYFLAGFDENMAFLSKAFAILPDQPEEVIEEEELATA